MYLRITPWQIEDFSVERYHDRLLALYRRMQVAGGLATSVHRFLVAARRPLR
jgi:hypothetical protein